MFYYEVYESFLPPREKDRSRLNVANHTETYFHVLLKEQNDHDLTNWHRQDQPVSHVRKEQPQPPRLQEEVRDARNYMRERRQSLSLELDWLPVEGFLYFAMP